MYEIILKENTFKFFLQSTEILLCSVTTNVLLNIRLYHLFLTQLIHRNVSDTNLIQLDQGHFLRLTAFVADSSPFAD